MKVLIISDLHLTKTVNLKKLKFLKELFGSVDKVIINGDFWDSLFLEFDDFINSEWKELFPILKKKKTIYLYGNHDRKEACDSRVFLFSVRQANQLRWSIKDRTLLIKHGHDFDLLFTRIVRKLKISHLFLRAYHYFEDLAVKVFGPSFISWCHKYYNKEIKDIIKNKLGDNEILICGHTHSVDFDLANKYINIGFTNYGVAQYLLIEDNNLPRAIIDYY
jgi:predicted phosphodiesterase